MSDWHLAASIEFRISKMGKNWTCLPNKMLPGRAVANLPQGSSLLVTIAYSEWKMNKSEAPNYLISCFWQIEPKLIRVLDWQAQGHIALRSHVHDWKFQDNG